MVFAGLDGRVDALFAYPRPYALAAPAGRALDHSSDRIDDQVAQEDRPRGLKLSGKRDHDRRPEAVDQSTGRRLFWNLGGIAIDYIRSH
jgi:hypothetical protein